MTYRNGVLYCAKPFCTITVAHWVWQLALEDARAAGWHVHPCDCERPDTPDSDRVHKRDYCPRHFPQPLRTVETLSLPPV